MLPHLHKFNRFSKSFQGGVGGQTFPRGQLPNLLPLKTCVQDNFWNAYDGKGGLWNYYIVEGWIPACYN